MVSGIPSVARLVHARYAAAPPAVRCSTEVQNGGVQRDEAANAECAASLSSPTAMSSSPGDVLVIMMSSPLCTSAKVTRLVWSSYVCHVSARFGAAHSAAQVRGAWIAWTAVAAKAA